MGTTRHHAETPRREEHFGKGGEDQQKYVAP